MGRLRGLGTAAVVAVLVTACGGTATTGGDEGAAPDVAATDAGTGGAMDDHSEAMEDHSEAMEDHSEAMDDHSDDMHGGSSEAPEGAMTIEIEMVDIAFAPTTVQVPAGEPIRFVFTNTGSATHEAVIGDEHVQQEHDEAMQAGEGHDDGHHGMVPAISLEPGESGELVHTFEEAGTTLIGCHVPGHYAAGMVIEVEVTG